MPSTVEMLAGDPVAAERILRQGYAVLEEMGDTALLSTTAAFLGQALLAQDRYKEADGLAELSAELTAGDDLVTQVLWRGVRARCLAVDGRLDEAERLAREAVTLAETTDFVNQRADALVDLGIVLGRLGRGEDAQSTFGEAIRLYEHKGNVVAAGRVRVRPCHARTALRRSDSLWSPGSNPYCRPQGRSRAALRPVRDGSRRRRRRDHLDARLALAAGRQEAGGLFRHERQAPRELIRSRRRSGSPSRARRTG